MAEGVSEALKLVSSQGYTSDWDSLPLQNLSTRHPALPPSALGGYTSRFSARADAPVEVITNQMAGILRAVQDKVRRIEVSERNPFLHSNANHLERMHNSEPQSIDPPPFRAHRLTGY